MDSEAQLSHAEQERVITWVARHVIPYEPSVRNWLSRRVPCPEDADDLIQEAYARLASLRDVERVSAPRAYFLQVVRNLLTDHIRRERIVRIEAVADVEEYCSADEEPGPDRIVAGRRDWELVSSLVEALPERYRQIFKLRKIEGLSQREIALRLGVTESIVENDGVRGLRLVMTALKKQGYDLPEPKKEKNGRPGSR